MLVGRLLDLPLSPSLLVCYAIDGALLELSAVVWLLC